MPKIIELTVEIDIQKVSCPGVWLCQSGRVSLTVFALGTSYQTCLLPPVFPLQFKDVFYFRKRFQETCALNNICCLLKDETIYCELVQWSEDCVSGGCMILAQYLGSLSDVLFPPKVCSSDGVDLLMRRSKEFPGILSPKIEIATKVRIDEVWSQSNNILDKGAKCQCIPTPELDGHRQKSVCHTPMYHRAKCSSHRRPISATKSRSRSRSGGSRSCYSFQPRENNVICGCPNPEKQPHVHLSPSRRRSPSRRGRSRYNVYNVETSARTPWLARNTPDGHFKECLNLIGTVDEPVKVVASLPNEERIQKVLLESRYVDVRRVSCATDTGRERHAARPQPCVCDICRRYHDLFHSGSADR